MFTEAVPGRSNPAARVAVASESERVQSARLLEGELGDLYAAILIAVPLAIFLKSLWS
jgi:hypothetical protein